MPCLLSTWNSSWAACWNEIGILLPHFRSAYRCSHVKQRGEGVLLTVDTWPVVELPHHSVQWPGQKWAVQKGQIDHLDSHARSRACQTSYVKFKRCNTSSTQKTWVEMQSGAFFLFSFSLSLFLTPWITSWDCWLLNSLPLTDRGCHCHLLLLLLGMSS